MMYVIIKAVNKVKEAYMLHVDHTPKQIRKIDLNNFFVARYQISPYSGCTHSCTYCDGRSEKYYFDGNFDEDLHISITTPNHLANQLKSAYEKGPLLIGSGYTDAYQPIEKKFKLTRQILINAQPFAKNHPIVIITKSDLILRDLDVLKTLAKKRQIIVMFSLISNNDALLSKIEPRATSASNRLKAIETLAKENIPVGVVAMPMMPYLTDRNKPLVSFLKTVKATGASFVIPGVLTLRPGENKDYFKKNLEKHFSELSNKILAIYSENNENGNPNSNYIKQFYQHIYGALDYVNLSPRVPMYLTQGWFNLYDSLSLLLEHLTVLYGNDNVRYQRLMTFAKHYDNWLKATRKQYQHKNEYYHLLNQATEQLILNPFNLEDDFDTKIKQFLKPILDDCIFDYEHKKWRCPK